MNPLSKEEIVEFGKEQVSEGRLSLQQMGKLNRLFHTALMTHTFKEALEWYADMEDMGEVARKALEGND